MLGKKRGAIQRTHVKHKRVLPTWLVTIAVLLALSFIAAILFLWHPWQANTLVPTTGEHTPLVGENDNATSHVKKQFEFYDLLPSQQVTPIPTHAPTNATVKKPEVSIDHNTPAEAGQAPNSGGKFILQINSFKTAEEADKLRSDVMLLGIDADIQVTTAAENEVWYRVFAGPFRSRSDAVLAQQRLQRSSIDSIVVEQKVQQDHTTSDDAEAAATVSAAADGYAH